MQGHTEEGRAAQHTHRGTASRRFEQVACSWDPCACCHWGSPSRRSACMLLRPVACKPASRHRQTTKGQTNEDEEEEEEEARTRIRMESTVWQKAVVCRGLHDGVLTWRLFVCLFFSVLTARLPFFCASRPAIVTRESVVSAARQLAQSASFRRSRGRARRSSHSRACTRRQHGGEKL
jgi:hypothetical protein